MDMPPPPSPQLHHAVATTLAPPFETVPRNAARVLYRIEQRRTEVDISVKTKYPTAIVSTCRPERQWTMGPYHDWSSLTWVVVGTVRHNRTVGVTGYINPRD